MKRMISGLLLMILVVMSSPAAAGDKPLSFSIGGGFTYRLSDLTSFFVEARYHYVRGPDVPTSTGGTEKADAQLFPITFGFRF